MNPLIDSTRIWLKACVVPKDSNEVLSARILLERLTEPHSGAEFQSFSIIQMLTLVGSFSKSNHVMWQKAHRVSSLSLSCCIRVRWRQSAFDRINKVYLFSAILMLGEYFRNWWTNSINNVRGVDYVLTENFRPPVIHYHTIESSESTDANWCIVL